MIASLWPCQAAWQRGVAALARSPSGLAPCISKILATLKCWFLKARNNGVCALISDVSAMAPWSRSNCTHSTFPPGKKKNNSGVCILLYDMSTMTPWSRSGCIYLTFLLRIKIETQGQLFVHKAPLIFKNFLLNF